MKKTLFLILVVITIAFNSQADTKQKDKSEEAKLIPNFNIAVKFINDYTAFCNSSSSNTMKWIQQNKLLTESFKISYKNLVDSANKADPEMGLGFDPIFDAQDYPEKGFSILASDIKTGFITVNGKDWQDFKLVLKVVYQNNKWLVDGAGVINIPEGEMAER